jgi:hypothetical protein
MAGGGGFIGFEGGRGHFEKRFPAVLNGFFTRRREDAKEGNNGRFSLKLANNYILLGWKYIIFSPSFASSRENHAFLDIENSDELEKITTEPWRTWRPEGKFFI